ncbi:hypothetical protein A5707_07800 [Mycobacterium kyorinense]|uniref:FUSC family protein n=1 Tax=Mycobacterium kyorinense TaxID=487514 RepID=A0A1A2YWQ6_9MYCO|nr:hypothetical protein [Mycobacterium kyorinense]OBI41351.1 hypothetical protein A5707_07800 [Mycobacterium kyorinense]
MTGPNDSSSRPISVAELLAKNGTIGAPPPAGRRRRRRGNDDAVTVAELTGEIPVVSEDTEPDETPAPASHSRRPNGAVRVDQPTDDQTADTTAYWSEPQPRWPESPPQPARESRPERSPYPLPVRKPLPVDDEQTDDADGAAAGAEGMNPDPLEDYAGMPVDVMDTDVREAEPATDDSAYVRSYLRSSASRLFGGKSASADVDAEAEAEADEDYGDDVDEDYPDIDDLDDDVAADADDTYAWPGRTETLMRGGLVVLQSILAVAFGAGLFIAFDQLWRWNNIVALVLSVLVILGLVVGVRVVRKTEDIASTLIAVAVGALVTLGPLALLQSG